MTIQNQGQTELRIATGRSCKEIQWKNKKITWAELVNKLAETTYTAETVAEYKAMNKDDQTRIKDIGGFVGGSLKEGRRKNGFVTSRSIVTLDADFAKPGLWEDIEAQTDYAMAVYSTHKHTPEHPRYRLVIPLSRDVSADEYEAIARKLADDIGMDFFDDTTYEPARMMFWPSTSKDGKYFFKVIDEKIINPDEVLATYDDWKDASYWPESSRCTSQRKKTADKQGDPLSKDGIVGAFCRTYDIHQAIATFLPEVYERCNDPNRYTYAGGSTAAGLVIYDNKFAYSNHGTDPISGQLCNAFDLVRIHKYHELDEEAKPGTPINKTPSWKAMMELATQDPEVKATLALEKINTAAAEFGPVDYTETDESQDQCNSSATEPQQMRKTSASDPQQKKAPHWTEKLTITKGGAFASSIDNMILIIKNDPNLKGLGRHNLFSDKVHAEPGLPWPRTGEYWTDIDDAGLRHYMEHVYGIEGRQKLQDASSIAFEDRAFHPVRDYLSRLKWDGQKRVENVLIDYLGSPDNAYTKELTKKTLTAAVKRIYEPGCKFDYMLTLVGEQGIGKSMLWNVLGGEWFSDSLSDVRGKEAFEALDGVWIMEMGELSALRKGDREAVKIFITKQTDTYRKAYARNVSVNKRQCIFIGTTNDKEFLNDATGGRRFWIVDTNAEEATKTVWDDLTKYERDQIWAEAVELYQAGENINSLSVGVLDHARQMQASHSENSSMMGIIEGFLQIEIPENWNEKTIAERSQWIQASEEFRTGENIKLVKREKICALEVWCEALGKNKADMTNRQAKEINECIDHLGGWKRSEAPQKYGPYGSQRGFMKEEY